MGKTLTRQQKKDLKTKAVITLGERFELLSVYDSEEFVRRAIVNYNYKHKGKVITLDEIADIVSRIDVEEAPEGSERLHSINNVESRRRGLSKLIGPKCYSVVSRDAAVLGTFIKLAREVRQTLDYQYSY